MNPVPPSTHRNSWAAAAALFTVLGALLAAQAVPLSAQSLAVGTASGLPGTAVDVTVGFTAGASSVSSLQFDLGFAGTLTHASTSAGAAASAAGKTVMGNTLAGGVRVIVFALNTTPISSGAVAVVRLNISSGAPGGPVPIAISGIVAADPNGNPVTAAGSGGSVTVNGGVDTTPPLISAVASSSVTQNSAAITWTTNENSDSQVEYGTTTSYGSLSSLTATMVMSHTSSLTGLSAGTLYHFRVRSRDAAGNLATSGDYTLTTSQAADTTPPVISSLAASSVTQTSATISWTTNEASNSQVEYGTTTAYGTLTTLNASMVTSHSVQVTGLTAGTLYHCRVRSRDAASNLAVSTDLTFTTPQAADTTPPVISALAASSVTQTSATISWTTNEASNSQVEYGTTTAYGTLTTLDANMVTSHSVQVTGLTGGTLYHCRVRSRDAASNLAVSTDLTFTTPQAADTTPPSISAVAAGSITSAAATITWTTNENSDSQVDYGTTASYGSTTALNSSMVTSHSAALSGLSANTLYHYRVRSRDAAGNLATSGDYTFTTNQTIDTTTPVISGPAASSVTQTSALISWTTNEASDSQVEYGTTTAYGSLTPLNATPVASHSVQLSGLTAGTLYHFRVRSRDAASNLAVSNDFTFTTTAGSDTTPPLIGSVASGSVTEASAVVIWTTNEPSDTQVDFGPTLSYGNATVLNGAMVTSHSAALGGLASNTLYHYRVKSRDAAGNLATSGDYTFTTAAAGETPPPGGDTTAPVISAVAVPSKTPTSATITWTTDEAADSQIEYGTTIAYGTLSEPDTVLTTNHSHTVTGLTPGTLHHFRIRARDAAGNLATSADYVFTTLAGSDTTPPVIGGVEVQSVSADRATIRWTTNEDADSRVEYGTTAAYGLLTALDGAKTTVHTVTVGGLSAKTAYHFRVRSADAAGNVAFSSDYLLTTTESADSTPPVISNLSVAAVSSSRATVSWTTNEDADSLVEYGATATYGSATALDSRKSVAHSVSLTGLSAKTLYHFRVRSTDAAGNAAVSAGLTFTTLALPEGGKKKLYLPRMATFGVTQGAASQSGEEYTGVAVVNLDSTEAALTFTAHDSTGALLSGEGITNPAVRLLNPGEQLPIVDTQLFGAGVAQGKVGWIEIDSSVTKLAGFFLVFDNSLKVLDGTNVSTLPTRTFVLPEIEDKGYTKLNVANPNAEDAVARIDLIRRDGTVRASTTRTVKSLGALAVEMRTDLFPDIVVESGDYLRGSSDRAVIPFQILGSNSEYIEVLGGQDAGAGSTTMYSPQYAVGGGWRSTLAIVNLEGRPGTLTLRFIGDDSNQIGLTRTAQIEAYGKVYVNSADFFLAHNGADLLQGYVEIRSSGPRLSGSVVFGDPERSRFSSALPLVTSLQSNLLFGQVASNDVYFTGLAILNPNGTDAVATIDLYGADGRLEASVTETIPARQRRAKVLTQFFPALAGVDKSSGYLRVTVDKPVASFALFGTNDLSALSAVPPQEIPQ